MKQRHGVRGSRYLGDLGSELLLAVTISIGWTAVAFSGSALPPTWVTQIGARTADPQLQWGSGRRLGPFVEIDSSDSTVVAATVKAGADANILIAKYSSPGSLLWQAEYAGPGTSEDHAMGLALGPDGGPVVVGSSAGGSSQNMFVVSYMPTGALRWARILDRDGTWQEALGVAVHRDGSVAVVGSSMSSSGTIRWVTTSLGPDGEVRWRRELGMLPASSEESNAAVAIDQQGRVVVAGTQAFPGSPTDVFVVTYAPDGRVVSEVGVDRGSTELLRAMRLTPTGEPVVALESVPQYGERRCALAKLTSGGTVQWTASFPEQVSEACHAADLAIDSQGSIVVVGWQTCYFCDLVIPRPLAVKYSSSGQFLWHWVQAQPEEGIWSAVTTDSTDSILIGGDPLLGRTGGVVKLGPEGVERWRSNSGWCRDIALGVGDSLAAVSTTAGPTNTDLQVLALGSSGKTLWIRKEGPASSAERVGGLHALAADGSGGSLVVGTTYETGKKELLATCLDAGGDVVWSQRWDNPEHGENLPVAAALDELGNALVASSTRVAAPTPGFGQWTQLRAYDPAGALVWSVPEVAMTPTAAVATSGGGFWVAGTRLDYPAYRVQRWNGAGSLGCEWTPALGQLPQARMVDAVAGQGESLVVTGSLPIAGGLTVALDAQCRPSWLVTTPSMGSGPDTLRPSLSAVAVGPGGVLAVVGALAPDTGSGVPFVQWSNPSTSQEWVRVDDCSSLGEPDCLDGGVYQAVAFDPDGNLIAAGWTSRAGTGRDITAVSYAHDGSRRWVRHFTLSGPDDDEATSVVVDGHGIAMVTGTVGTTDGDSDFVTIAYAPDGTERWIAQWSDPTPAGGDVAVAAARDRLGGLIVAGDSRVGPDVQITVLRLPNPSTGRMRRHLTR